MENNDKFCIFSVDDEPAVRHLIEHVLSSEYLLESFSSANDCLKRLAERKPDLLMLDIFMPVLDGLEFCQRLKDDVSTRDIPVLFLSATESEDLQLACFEVGGMDFFAKPFKPAELLHKIRTVRQVLENRRSLEEQASFAQRTAFTAMSSMGELGVVIEFLRRSFATNSARELAEIILGALQQYGLRGSVQIYFNNEIYTLSEQGENLPLEISVLKNLRKHDRIFEFKNRSVYNFGQMTLMVKDMPISDADRCGRIRDNLAILAEGADARIQAIELDQANRAKKVGIGNALGSVNQTLARLYEGQRRRNFQSVGLIGELQNSLLKSFVHLGLTTAQENTLTDMIHHYMESMLDLTRQNDEIAVELESLAKTLKTIGE